MRLNEYQRHAATTAIYPSERGLEYLSTGLASECGEVCGKIAKAFRKDRPLDRAGVLDELGDVLWFVSELSRHLEADLESVANNNLNKLSGRAERGTLQGDGDKR